MSLTMRLKEPVIRKFMNACFEQPKFDVSTDIKIKSPCIASNPALVGTAFDYLLRFNIDRLNFGIANSGDKWVAQIAVEKMCAAKNFGDTNNINIFDFTSVDINSIDSGSINAIEKLNRAVSEWTKFMKRGKNTKALIKSTIELAQLDIYYRGGPTAYRSSFHCKAIDKNDVNDIETLIKNIDFEKFRSVTGRCLLNPTFGIGSTLVKGADADLIIDDMLIDIKTTKKLSFTREMFNQLMGYYLLGRIGGIYGESGDVIKRIGIYFSRYDLLYMYDIDKIINPANIDAVTHEFENINNVFNEREEKSDELFQHI